MSVDQMILLAWVAAGFLAVAIVAETMLLLDEIGGQK